MGQQRRATWERRRLRDAISAHNHLLYQTVLTTIQLAEASPPGQYQMNFEQVPELAAALACSPSQINGMIAQMCIHHGRAATPEAWAAKRADMLRNPPFVPYRS